MNGNDMDGADAFRDGAACQFRTVEDDIVGGGRSIPAS